MGGGDGAGPVAVGTRGSERSSSTEIVASVDGVDDVVADVVPVEAAAELELEVAGPDDPHPAARSELTSTTARSIEAWPHGRSDRADSSSVARIRARTEKITSSLGARLSQENVPHAPCR
jgi:hypothetical protein